MVECRRPVEAGRFFFQIKDYEIFLHTNPFK
jgi:hypothetical protein